MWPSGTLMDSFGLLYALTVLIHCILVGLLFSDENIRIGLDGVAV